ncbi:MAG: hypothetical protein NVSMB65_01820 [Chloroflexota bacterium]
MAGVFSPLDEELGLSRSCLTPFVQESLVRLGTWMSFAHAARELAHHAHVQISASTARRLTEASGAAYVAVQTAQVAALERDLPPAPAGPALQQLSADGAHVPLVGGTWAEVKTLAVGTVVTRTTCTTRDREQPVHTEDISYFSRLADHATFTRLALVETHRRGTERAGQVVAVMDGALWLQEFVATHRPDAVRIVDWPHVVGYLAQVARAVYGEETPAARAWLAQQRHLLLEEAPEPVVATLQRLHGQVEAVARAEQAPWSWTVALVGRERGGQGVLTAPMAATALPVVEEALGYLEARVAQLRYAAFRAAGYPIGSGMVESANKLLVEGRLKGAGRRWARAHVNSLLGLRTVAFADRWAEATTQIGAYERQQAHAATTTRRQQQHAARAAAAASSPRGAAPPAPEQGPPAPLPAAPAAAHTTPVPVAAPASPPRARRSFRPAAEHPWRRGPAVLPRSA